MSLLSCAPFEEKNKTKKKGKKSHHRKSHAAMHAVRLCAYSVHSRLNPTLYVSEEKTVFLLLRVAAAITIIAIALTLHQTKCNYEKDSTQSQSARLHLRPEQYYRYATGSHRDECASSLFANKPLTAAILRADCSLYIQSSVHSSLPQTPTLAVEPRCAAESLIQDIVSARADTARRRCTGIT